MEGMIQDKACYLTPKRRCRIVFRLSDLTKPYIHESELGPSDKSIYAYPIPPYYTSYCISYTCTPLHTLCSGYSFY